MVAFYYLPPFPLLGTFHVLNSQVTPVLLLFFQDSRQCLWSLLFRDCSGFPFCLKGTLYKLLALLCRTALVQTAVCVSSSPIMLLWCLRRFKFVSSRADRTSSFIFLSSQMLSDQVQNWTGSEGVEHELVKIWHMWFKTAQIFVEISSLM